MVLESLATGPKPSPHAQPKAARRGSEALLITGGLAPCPAGASPTLPSLRQTCLLTSSSLGADWNVRHTGTFVMNGCLEQTPRGQGLSPGTDRAFSVCSLDTGGSSRPTRLQWTSWPFRAQCPSAARPVMPCRVTTTTSHSPSRLTGFREAPHWRAGGAPTGL